MTGKIHIRNGICPKCNQALLKKNRIIGQQDLMQVGLDPGTIGCKSLSATVSANE